MTAAPAVAPPSGLASIKPPITLPAPGGGDGFGQVLQSARDAANGSASVAGAPVKDAQTLTASAKARTVETIAVGPPRSTAKTVPTGSPKPEQTVLPAQETTGPRLTNGQVAVPEQQNPDTGVSRPATGPLPYIPAIVTMAKVPESPKAVPPKARKYNATIGNSARPAIAESMSANAAQQAVASVAMAIPPVASRESGGQPPPADVVLQSNASRASPVASHAPTGSAKSVPGAAVPVAKPGTIPADAPPPSATAGSPMSPTQDRLMPLPGGAAFAIKPDTASRPSQPVSESASPAVPIPSQSHTTQTVVPAPAAHDRGIALQPVGDSSGLAQPAAISVALLQQNGPVAAASTTPQATAPVMAAAPALPAAQLAPALLTLAKAPGGSHQMTVLLHPADLGAVQITIARSGSGITQVAITADNSATLLALQHDRPQLLRTLDDAGIAAAGRTVTFHAAQPAQASANSTGSSPGGQQGLPDRPQGGGGDSAGSPGGGRPARQPNSYASSRGQTGTAGIAAAKTGKTYRIGLDITA